MTREKGYQMLAVTRGDNGGSMREVRTQIDTLPVVITVDEYDEDKLSEPLGLRSWYAVWAGWETCNTVMERGPLLRAVGSLAAW